MKSARFQQLFSNQEDDNDNMINVVDENNIKT
jgi:hypothetical protein